MRFWLVGSVLILLLAGPVFAQEKACQVETANLYVVKQSREAAELRAAQLAVRLEQMIKQKEALEKQLAEKKAAE